MICCPVCLGGLYASKALLGWQRYRLRLIALRCLSLPDTKFIGAMLQEGVSSCTLPFCLKLIFLLSVKLIELFPQRTGAEPFFAAYPRICTGMTR